MKQQLIKLTLLSVLATSSLYASDLNIESLGINIGMSNSNYSQKDHQGSITLGNTPDEQFSSYEIYTLLNKDILGMKPYISYTYSINDDLKHQYILVGLNKYYTHDKIDLYAGILLGYGELKYRYNPLNNAQNTNIDANSIVAGLQLGAQYPITNKYSVTLNTKYLVHDYQTQLKPSSSSHSTLEHKSTSVISVGLNYSF
jgi:hypothetical protein